MIEAKDTEIEALRTSRQTQLDTLRAQVAALSAEVAELRARVGQNPRNSSKPPSSEGLAKPALDGLEIEQTIFIGSSFGGFHSVNLAVLHPERVRAMVLLVPAATIKPFKPLANIGIRTGSLVALPRTVKPALRAMMAADLPDERDRRANGSRCCRLPLRQAVDLPIRDP